MGSRNKKKIYSIILTNHGKQKYVLKSEETEEKIYKVFNKLLKENKKVAFPTRYNNEKHVMVESDYELVIIKCKELGDKDVTKVKNDYGEYVNYESSDEDWIIVDRARYSVEETFFVYGFHPKLQRKTFEWVFDNIISKDAKSKYMFKTVQILLNKVLIDSNGKLDMVICKNKNDAIRFYNLIEEWCKKRRFKYVIFMGDVGNSIYRKDWVERIQKLTNWTLLKINRPSTRP